MAATEEELRRLEEDLLLLDRLAKQEVDQERKERAMLTAAEQELRDKERQYRGGRDRDRDRHRDRHHDDDDDGRDRRGRSRRRYSDDESDRDRDREGPYGSSSRAFDRPDRGHPSPGGGGGYGGGQPTAALPDDEALAVRRVLMAQEERAFRAQRELEELRYRRQLFEAQQRNDYFRGLLRHVQEQERRRLAEEREVDRLRQRMHQHRLDAMVNEELILRDRARRAAAPDADADVSAAKQRMEALQAQMYFQSIIDSVAADEDPGAPTGLITGPPDAGGAGSMRGAEEGDSRAAAAVAEGM
eukprot:TRINITY_DN2919_c0_g1_i1.p1 TRINITY_DN2919_c0_g1~~TRINITY_DN2919_c0_g1_i1.p1  ORF type:complete len:326 (-),score=57.13 TRINITY_DN2919_c0_g1_i1:652-1554(-)